MNTKTETICGQGTPSVLMGGGALLAAALLFPTMVSVAQAGDLFQEVANVNQQLTDVSYGTDYSTPLMIDRFDTMDGTRELLGITAGYFVGEDYTVIVEDNLLSEYVAAQGDWEVSWTGSIMGDRIFPNPAGPNTHLGGASGYGYFLGPFQPGYTQSFVGGGWGSGDLFTDPDFVSMFIGTEPLIFDSNFSITDVVMSDPQGPGFPPHIFDPDSIEFILDAMNLELSLTYNYILVPEPASLCLLGFGAVTLVRRRRFRAGPVWRLSVTAGPRSVAARRPSLPARRAT